MRGDDKYWPRGSGQEMVPSAVIPPPLASPPPPPPPDSGRGVAQRSTVDVTGATEALVVGPHDVLVISFPQDTDMEELYAMRDRMRDSNLRDGQILLIAGADKMVKVTREHGRAEGIIRWDGG